MSLLEAVGETVSPGTAVAATDRSSMHTSQSCRVHGVYLGELRRIYALRREQSMGPHGRPPRVRAVDRYAAVACMTSRPSFPIHTRSWASRRSWFVHRFERDVHPCGAGRCCGDVEAGVRGTGAAREVSVEALAGIGGRGASSL